MSHGKFFQHLPLKHKIFLFQALLLIVLAVATLIALQWTLEVYDQALVDSSVQTVSASMAGVENKLQTLERLNYSLAYNSRIQELLRQLKKTSGSNIRAELIGSLKETVQMVSLAETDLDAILFQDSNQKVLMTVMGDYVVDSVGLEPAIQSADQGAGRVVWVVSPQGGSRLILARRVLDSGQDLLNFLGHVLLIVDMQRIAQRYSVMLPYSSVRFAVVSQGKVLYTRGFVPADAISPAPEESPQSHRLVTIEGQRFLAVSIASVTGPVQYLSLLPYDQLLSRSGALRTAVLVFFLLMLLGTFLASLFLAGTITGPLEVLARRMKQIEGELMNPLLLPVDQPWEQIHQVLMARHDEIGTLHRNYQVMIERINGLIEENVSKQVLVRESEYRALQAQINPHFLYNTLNSINWMARINHQESISLMIESLGNLFRASILPAKAEQSVSDELALLENYLNIQRIRFGARISIVFEIPEAHRSYLLPCFTFQALVENSIRYGVEASPHPVHIRLWSRDHDGRVEFILTDDGPGFDAKTAAQVLSGDSPGIGLKNIQSRLKMLYGEASTFQIVSEQGRGATLCFSVRREPPHGS